MNAKHFIHLCTVAVLFQNKFSYVESTEIAEGPMQGMNIFRQTGDACEPWERLYEGESKTTDIDTIEQEAEALEYLFNTSKWENPGDSKRNLVTNISSVLLKSPKLIYDGSATTFTNALGVLGGFWSIIADNFNASLNEMAGDLLRRSMHEGMKRINNDVKRKQEELDASSNKVEELELLLEEMSSYYANCIDDTETFGCMKSALRFITGNRFKFLDSERTRNKTKKVKRLEFETEIYRRYMLVSVASYSTALLVLPDQDNYRLKRRMYEYILEKLLEDFASFVEGNVGEIVTIWGDPKTYKANCLRSIASEHVALQHNANISYFRFHTGDASWGECIWGTSYLPSLDKKEVCKQFAFDLGPRRSSIRTKAESYWNPYKEKLVDPESIYSRIKQLVTGGCFNNTLLNNIKSAEVRSSREIESLTLNSSG